MTETFALVTGGSSGIGLELAKLLVARGYSLLLVSNQEERLNLDTSVRFVPVISVL